MSKNGFAAAFGAGSQNKNMIYPNAATWSPGGLQLGVSEDFPYLASPRALASYRGWIYNAVSTISNDIAALDINVVTVKRDGSEDEQPRHPLYDLIAHPNAWQRGNLQRQTASLHLDLVGEAFFYVPRAPRGPEAIHLLQPDKVYVVPHPEEYITGYLYYTWNGTMLAFLPEEIIHVRYANPDDPYRGYSPVRGLGFVPQLNDSLRAYVAKYLQGNARPGGVLSTEQSLTMDQKKLVTQMWNEVHQGSGGAGQTAVLSNGTKYQPIQDGVGALNVKDLGNFGADDVLAAYNMPRAKLGLVADANRANADAADYTYRSNCLKPRAAIWQEQLYQPLLEMYGAGPKLQARVENPVPSDNEAEFKEANALFTSGALTLKQFLTRLKAPEADTAADLYYLPPKVTLVSDLEEHREAQAAQPEVDAQNPQDDAETPPEAPGSAPKAPKSPQKARLRSLFARMYAERRDNRADRAVDVDRLTALTGDPITAAGILLTIDEQVRQHGLVTTFETLKSNRATGPLAELLGEP